MKRDYDKLHHELEITLKDKDGMKKVITRLEDERDNMRNVNSKLERENDRRKVILTLEDKRNDMKKVINNLEDETDDIGNVINDLQNQLVSCRDSPFNETQNEKIPMKMTISCDTDIDEKNLC